jgi:hypothetical protein
MNREEFDKFDAELEIWSKEKQEGIVGKLMMSKEYRALHGKSPSERIRFLYSTYRSSMAHVARLDSSGDWKNGAAFHVGDGWLVSARHVVECATKIELTPYGGSFDQIELREIVFPTDSDVDLALLQTNLQEVARGAIPDIPIGEHMDDFLDDGFVMSKVLLMGYPPVPLSRRADLIAASGEVNALIDKYAGPRHPHFIVSSTARGGFSGGPLISEFGYLLGVMTESLRLDSLVTELGFASAITVEPLWGLLTDNSIHPGANAEAAKYWSFDDDAVNERFGTQFDPYKGLRF